MCQSTQTPPAPDYTAAANAATNADINSLPLRRLIDSAATLGKIVDKTTGKIITPDEYQAGQTFNQNKLNDALARGDTAAANEAQAALNNYADFRGAGSADVAQQQLLQQIGGAQDTTKALLDLRQQYGTQFADQSRKELAATDPTGFALRDQFGGQLADGSNSIASLVKGNTAPSYEKFSDSNLPQYGTLDPNSAPDFTKLTASDLPQFSQLGSGPDLQTVGGGPSLDRVNTSLLPQFQTVGNSPRLQQLRSSQLPTLRTLGDANSLDRVAASDVPTLQRLSDQGLPQLQQLGQSSLPTMTGVNGITLGDTGASQAGRADLEKQVFDELSRAGTADPALQRQAEQAARARGSATGNILSDSNALNESMAVQLAQRQLDAGRRSDALSLLNSGQTTSDKGNALAQSQLAADQSAAGFNNAASQQGFQNQVAQNAQDNNTATQALQNRSGIAGFNNNATQGDFTNLLSRLNANNSATTQDLANQSNVAGFNNAAGQTQLQNVLAQLGFNNASKTQQFSNNVTATNTNNQAAQGQLNSLLSALGFNNTAGQTEYQNQVGATGFNNAAAQQGFANDATTAGFNNQTNQQGYQNIANNANFNNAASQQSFQNQGTIQQFNNNVADQSFNAAMAAINQRNQATQNQFSGQQQVLGTDINARQQDNANVQSFLGLQPIVSQGAQLGGLQNGASPFNAGNVQNGDQTNGGAAQNGAAFAGNIFGTQTSAANAANSQGSPWGALAGAALGSFLGPAGTAVGGAAGKALFPCHVAREVYGETNPQWVPFYYWKELVAPRWFKRLYNRYSRQVAAIIRPFPSVKTGIRRWMDSRVQSAIPLAA